MKNNNIMAKIIFGALLFYFFLIFDTNFHGPDEPIYFAYTQSIVEDKDLNIVNNIDYIQHPFYLVSGKNEVSPTYNLPDYHAHGGVVFWSPFYIYAKTLSDCVNESNLKSVLNYGKSRLTACAMSLSTIIFGFLTILLTYFLSMRFFSAKISLLSSMVILFGTPFFYFVVYETANAQIVAALFSVISIYFLFYAVSLNRLQWFFYGMFFSVCAVVKYDIWFQGLSILLWLFYLVSFKQLDWKKGFYFIAGFLPGIMLKVINDYLKYGSFHQGEFGLLNFNSFYFFQQLFSPYHGFVYTSPIFYICFGGSAVLLIRLFKNRVQLQGFAERDLFIFIISLSLFIKIFFMSFRYAWGGGTPGARLLLSDYSIFVLLYACALSSQKKITKYLLIFLSALFVFWNLIVIAEFIAKVDIQNLGKTVSLAARINLLKYLYQPLFLIKDLGLKLLLSPLLAILAGIFYALLHLEKKSRIYLHGSFIYLTVYCFLSYAFVTAINVQNNVLNVIKLRQNGFFHNARVIGPLEFEKLENNSSIEEMIEYNQIIGNRNLQKKLENIKNKYYLNY